MRDKAGCGVGDLGSGIVFMPSLSILKFGVDVIFKRCGVDIDFVTVLFIGVGVKDRSREGVTVPVDPAACTHWAVWIYLR